MRTPRRVWARLSSFAVLVGLLALSAPALAGPTFQLSGVVHLADGTVAGGAQVTAIESGGGAAFIATTDGAGAYAITLAAGSYDLEVAWTTALTPGFSTQGRTVATSVAVAADTVQDLSVPTIVLSGHILDATAAPVPNVKLTAVAFADNASAGGFDSISVTSAADGSFRVTILPNDYINLTLTPPAASAYALTALPDQTFSVDLAQDYVVKSAVTLSGTVTFSDGTSGAGVTVTAGPTGGGATTSTVADGAGHYSLLVAPDTYFLDAAFDSTILPGFSTGGVTVVPSVDTTAGSAVKDLVIPLIVLSGRVVDSAAATVAGVTFHAVAFSTGNEGGTDTIQATSAADGSFTARILSNSYFGIQLTPPAASVYVTTSVASQAFTVDTAQDFLIERPFATTGVVLLADGTPAAGVTVVATSSGGLATAATTDATGAYALSLEAGTYDFDVSWTTALTPGFSSGGTTVASGVAIAADLVEDLTVPTFVVDGSVVDGGGAPVPNVQFTAFAFSRGDGGGADEIQVITDAAGKFKLSAVANDYFSLRLAPSASGYLLTSAPDQTITGATTLGFVLDGASADPKNCLQANHCKSGFCVDGYCCDRACAGQCEACDLAAKGVCGLVTGAPASGRLACDSDGSACGGTCSGASASCTYPGASTSCGPESCSAGIAHLPPVCDGAGQCGASLLASCDPYTCGPTACLTGCATVADCSSGHVCVAGACVPPQPDGAACATGGDCASGSCVSGICCDSGCGPCGSCATGTCLPTSGSCGDYRCDGVTPGCQSFCTGDASCVAGAYCQGNQCLPKQANGAACTGTDACQSGFCVDGVCCDVACGSGATTDCQACAKLAGAASDGVCGPVLDGNLCSDGDACTQLDACQAGACVGSNPISCAGAGNCRLAGTCDPSTGACSSPVAPDGSPCSDGDACTQSDSCLAGACLGASPVVCGALDTCHVPGTCNPSTGACSNPPGPDDTPCTDGDACTLGDRCQSGLCLGATVVVCSATDACHAAGTCDPVTGVCSNPAAPDGLPCDDGDACTLTDGCVSGACTGGAPVSCAPIDACHAAGLCDALSGACTSPPVTDGTPCSGGSCVAGTCAAFPDLGVTDMATAGPDLVAAAADLTVVAVDAATPADAATGPDLASATDAAPAVDATTTVDAATASDLTTAVDAATSPDLATPADSAILVTPDLASASDLATVTDGATAVDAAIPVDAAMPVDAATAGDASTMVDLSMVIVIDAAPRSDAAVGPDLTTPSSSDAATDGAGVPDAIAAPDSAGSEGGVIIVIPDGGTSDGGDAGESSDGATLGDGAAMGDSAAAGDGAAMPDGGEIDGAGADLAATVDLTGFLAGDEDGVGLVDATTRTDGATLPDGGPDLAGYTSGFAGGGCGCEVGARSTPLPMSALLALPFLLATIRRRRRR